MMGDAAGRDLDKLLKSAAAVTPQHATRQQNPTSTRAHTRQLLTVGVTPVKANNIV